MNEPPMDWDLTLHNLQWSVNSQKNDTSGFSPIDLVFDFHAVDVLQNHLTAAIHADLEHNGKKDSVIANRYQAVAKIACERAKWKHTSDIDIKLSDPYIYSTGDLVVIENDQAATGESRKLEPRSSRHRRYPRIFPDKMKPRCSNIPELEVSEVEDDRIEDDLSAGLVEL